MKETPAKTIDQEIIDLIFKESKPMYDRNEAIEKVQYLIDMLTKVQKNEVCKKLERCDYFIERKLKGMDESKIRSLTCRKFDIDRRRIAGACEPCENRLKKIVKS